MIDYGRWTDYILNDAYETSSPSKKYKRRNFKSSPISLSFEVDVEIWFIGLYRPCCGVQVLFITFLQPPNIYLIKNGLKLYFHLVFAGT